MKEIVVIDYQIKVDSIACRYDLRNAYYFKMDLNGPKTNSNNN